jgi:hypothetical protein
VEYLVVTSILLIVWLVHESSPSGLIEALKTWHAQFLWAMSIPW